MKGIQQPSFIAKSAKMAEDVFIGAFSYIGEQVKIGSNTKIFPNCFIGDNVVIGENCIIHPGVKIYHDCILMNNVSHPCRHGDRLRWFGFAPQADGSFKKVPQIGNVLH
jgi:UDP-3-O-[3-hydroxymyristoyl] glucosamine N-acyltransferase